MYEGNKKTNSLYNPLRDTALPMQEWVIVPPGLGLSLEKLSSCLGLTVTLGWSLDLVGWGRGDSR